MVEDINGNLLRGVTVQEINHVYGANGLQAGNSSFPTGSGASFQDVIWTSVAVKQDQQFHVGDIKLFVEERDKTQYGTLGIYSDRNWVIINGNWGTVDNKPYGDKIYGP